MNKLHYSVSLREKGLSTAEIKEKMREKNFEEAQIEYYLKKSDEIFLNQSFQSRRAKHSSKAKKIIRMVTLMLSLILLAAVFFGYARIGLIGLFVVWSMIKLTSYRK